MLSLQRVSSNFPNMNVSSISSYDPKYAIMLIGRSGRDTEIHTYI